jgi:hypothetical protein
LLSTHITDTTLHHYIETDLGYYEAYEAYTADLPAIEKIGNLLPQAHVVIPSRRLCSDCARNIPQITKIAEYLPGWSWDIFENADYPERRESLNITHVPTFIVYDREGGQELGRIIENPQTGSLEHDLLLILQNQPT